MDWNLLFQGAIALGTTATAFGVWFAWDNSKKLAEEISLYKEELNLLKQSLENQNKELKANHDWNRRHLAIEKIIEIRTLLKEYRNNEFEKKLEYSNRQITEPYKVKELHLLMCKVDENQQLIWNNDKHCELTEEGRILCNQIADFLDIYEIIADAVLENTFDEEIVKNILKGSMNKAYHLFKEYIIHLREHYKRPLLYINLENLIKKWEKEETKVSKRAPTDLNS